MIHAQIDLVIWLMVVLFIWIGVATYVILQKFRIFARLLAELCLRLCFLTTPASGPCKMGIRQLQGDNVTMGQILGIAPGATGQFSEIPLPDGAQFPVGTSFSWSSDDTTNTALTPSADGTKCAVTAAASIANGATSFNLTCTSSFTPVGASSPLSVTVSVPFNIPAPPPPPAPTSMDIVQTA